MLTENEFKKYGYQVIDIIAEYLNNIELRNVSTNILPGEIKKNIPAQIPEFPEQFNSILDDVKNSIIPNLTHWQHPGFMALFPGNTSFESILGETMAAGLGVNVMMRQTSPSATELEEKMMEWVRTHFGLPKNFVGVIQDTASTGTLTAIVCAREKISSYSINENGFELTPPLILYCSDQTHYSIEKGAKVAGIGKNNVRKIKTHADFSMDVELLELEIKKDIESGRKPFMVVAALGTTNTCAFDPLESIGKICAAYKLWLHVDAAYAGNAFILPEYQFYLKGIEYADSYVFNPHKWLFTNFDCSVLFVKDTTQLIETFASNPEYLKVKSEEQVINYKDWGIPLGRRFRALKMWFVFRSFGVSGLQQKLRFHILLAQKLQNWFDEKNDWEWMAPVQLNVLCLRFHPQEITDLATLNLINETILKVLNMQGSFYLSGTMLHHQFAIRIVVGQTNVEEKHIASLFELMQRIAEEAKINCVI